MNKILVLAKNRRTYFTERLIEEVGDRRLVFWNPFDHAVPPRDFSMVLCRTTGIHHSTQDLVFLDSVTVPVLNPLGSLKRFRSKPSQYEFLSTDFPVLPWNLLKDSFSWDWARHPEVLVKPCFGQGGWGIQVLDRQAFYIWIEHQRHIGDLDYLMQPFVRGDEYRIFFIDHRVFVLRRYSPGAAANFAQGGEAEVAELPPPLMGIVKELIQTSGARYGGIDLMVVSGKPYILELNTVPGIEQLEKVTKINIMRILAEELLC
jgi:glutathione synthase/RimK-type ligase-like ATP-grasp enzyme